MELGVITHLTVIYSSGISLAENDTAKSEVGLRVSHLCQLTLARCCTSEAQHPILVVLAGSV